MCNYIMKIIINQLEKELLSHIDKLDMKKSSDIMEKVGREQAISEKLPGIAAEIRKNTQDKSNDHILFQEFKKQAFDKSDNIQRFNNEITWIVGTNLFEKAAEFNIEDKKFFGFIIGYVEEIFEELFDSILEVELLPQKTQNIFSLKITRFDDARQWINSILKEVAKLKKLESAKILEECGRICGKSHGLPELSQEIRNQVENKSDLEGLFNLYKKNCYNNSPRLQKKGNVIHLEYHECGCPIVKERKIIDPVFCNCTVGYTKERFETLFNCPVQVELLGSIIQGDDKCIQRIIILDK